MLWLTWQHGMATYKSIYFKNNDINNGGDVRLTLPTTEIFIVINILYFIPTTEIIVDPINWVLSERYNDNSEQNLHINKK